MEKISRTLNITFYCDCGDISVRKADIYMDGDEEVGRVESNNRYSPSLAFRKQDLLDALADQPREQEIIDNLWSAEYLASKSVE